MKSIINKINIKKSSIYIIYIISISISSLAYSQEKTYLTPDINIISVTPVQGSGMSIDRVPGKIQTINRESIGKKKISQ